jgi:hypothetical protein
VLYRVGLPVGNQTYSPKILGTSRGGMMSPNATIALCANKYVHLIPWTNHSSITQSEQQPQQHLYSTVSLPKWKKQWDTGKKILRCGGAGPITYHMVMTPHTAWLNN